MGKHPVSYMHNVRFVNISHSLSPSGSFLNIMQETWEKEDRPKRHTALHECWCFGYSFIFSKTENTKTKTKTKTTQNQRATP
jgi:hypothetical protein